MKFTSWNANIKLVTYLLILEENKEYLKFNSTSAPIERLQIDRDVNNIFSTHP